MVAKDQTNQPVEMIDLNALWTPLVISGPDSKAFLAGQLASDVNALTPGDSQLAAYLNPKGRSLGLLLLCPRNDGYLALVNPTIAQSLMQRLRMFVLRSKVTIEIMPGASVTGCSPINPLDAWHSEGRSDHFAIGWPGGREILVGSMDNPAITSDQWLAEDTRLGMPHLFESTLETFIPQQLNLDAWGAVSLKKGCYPGQEIVARMHYLGRNKRHLYRAKSDRSLVPGATVVNVEGRPAGQVVQSASDGDSFVALLVLHESMNDSALLVDGASLEVEARVQREA